MRTKKKITKVRDIFGMFPRNTRSIEKEMKEIDIELDSKLLR